MSNRVLREVGKTVLGRVCYSVLEGMRQGMACHAQESPKNNGLENAGRNWVMCLGAMC